MTTGGCLCGALKLTTTGDWLFCAHCHCAWCRRAHGAAFVTWFGVPAERFTLDDPDAALRWYRSSPESERGFCGVCGTTLLFRSALAPGEVHVALACIDGEPQRLPAAHVFWEAHVPWVTLADGLPTCDRDHPALRKYQAIARVP